MLRFKMRGSQGDLYLVEVHTTAAATLRLTCTCEAADHGIHCHHRIELLRGDAKNLVSKNAADVAELQRMLVGTKLAAAMEELAAAERAQAEAKVARDRCMHAVDRLLLGA